MSKNSGITHEKQKPYAPSIGSGYVGSLLANAFVIENK